VGTPPADAQRWTSILLSLYGGTMCLCSPICGYISDHLSSRQRGLFLDMFFVTAATVLFCIALRIECLAIARVLEGLSAATLYTTGAALIVDTYEPNSVGEAMGWLGRIPAIGTLISPIIGGAIYDYAGYRASFSVVFALIGVCFVMRLGMLEKKSAVRWNDLAAGAKDLAIQVDKGAEAPTLIEPRPLEASNPDEGIARGFISSKRYPIMVRLLLKRRFLVAIWASFIEHVLLVGLDAVIALFVQSQFHWDATAAGLSFIPLYLPSLLGPAIGRLVSRIGARWPITLAFILSVPGFICLRYVREDTIGDKVLFCALLTFLGITFTLVMVAVMTEIAAVLQKEGLGECDTKLLGYAQAYGLFESACGGGMLAGPLLAGFVRDSLGWNDLTLILGCISAGTAVVVGIWMTPESEDDRDHATTSESV